MRFIVFLIFFVYVYCEISFFIMVANSIGVFLALIGIIATSMIGFSLVKTQGVRNLSIMQQKIANEQNPQNEIVKSVALLFSGFFLLIPGFLTDILGAILLIPYVQEYVAKLMVSKMPIKSRFVSPKSNYQDDGIIEGEFKRKDDE
ncbi:FxsA family protein [uncultured Gilliamella sp.]|uniref:FxsA family protein n=1 Tax=uncultured Gilliamella sp. TaxID=1193505 RepID=UPI0025F926D9|nr:FxsA family protein [uncultured Gilliamella sp.]